MSFRNSFRNSFTELARSVSIESIRDPTESPIAEPRSFAPAFAAVVICGTFNNFAYCIISGASQNLAKRLRMDSQVTLLTTSMNTACLAATVISTRLLLRFRFYTRVQLVLAMSATAYIGVAVASTMNGTAGFALVAVFSCFAGLAQVIGEITNLAFLKAFPPELIGGWGAGTGIAGILGGGVYILLAGPLELSNLLIFGMMAPTLLAYWAAFHFLHTQGTRGLEGFHLARVLGGARALAREGSVGGPQEQLQPSSARAPASWPNVKLAFRTSGSIMFNLVAVYCLEYTIYPGLDDRETLCSSRTWYTAMWMCYNVGVTMSRLSVVVFRIERVWLLTALQLANVVGWTLEVFSGAIRESLPGEGGLYFMAVWMVLVGLCGGATYGNCMYLFNRREGIPDNIRELGINLGFLMSNIGITAATFSFSVLDSTVLAKTVLYPQGC